jgi:hypothetical protein
MSELNSETVVESTGALALDDATQETPNNLQESAPEGQALSDLLSEPEPEKETAPPSKEPGWVKKRIDSALQKQLPEMVAAEAAKIRAEYEAQLKPLREAQLSRDADELVQQGEFKSKERALEYLRLKQGMPTPPVQDEPVRNERGQFVAKETIPPEVKARADRLMAQAEYAKKMDNIDPLEIYRSNPDVARLVNSGEWDFSDVVKAAKGQPTPTPVYTSNAATPSRRGPHELSKDEWARLNENLAKGVKVDMRR